MENMMKYFKNKQNELFVDPIVENHIGLEELTKEEFDTQLAENNTPSDAEVLASRVAETKSYLAATDYKVLPDYDGDIIGVIEARAEARTFIRANEIKEIPPTI
jgi:hypothetical protein